MKITIKTSGFEELARALRALPEGVAGARLAAALRAAGEPIRADMAAAAPRAPGAPDLADSMTMNSVTRVGSPAGGRWEIRERTEAAIAIGPSKDAFYGLYQEYGTSRHGAQPFARPAWDRNVGKALETIRARLWIEVRRKVRGPR